MYEADPFAAQKSVAERQEKAARKREEAQQSTKATASKSEPDPFDNSPEVRLTSELRGLVENAIKMVIILSCSISIGHSRSY